MEDIVNFVISQSCYGLWEKTWRIHYGTISCILPPHPLSRQRINFSRHLLFALDFNKQTNHSKPLDFSKISLPCQIVTRLLVQVCTVAISLLNALNFTCSRNYSHSYSQGPTFRKNYLHQLLGLKSCIMNKLYLWKLLRFLLNHSLEFCQSRWKKIQASAVHLNSNHLVQKEKSIDEDNYGTMCKIQRRNDNTMKKKESTFLFI